MTFIISWFKAFSLRCSNYLLFVCWQHFSAFPIPSKWTFLDVFFFFLLLRFFTLGEKRSQENQRVVVRAAQCSSCLWLSVLFPLSAALWGWSRNNWKKETKTKNRTKVVCVLKVKLLLSSQRIKNTERTGDRYEHLWLLLSPFLEPTPPHSPLHPHLQTLISHEPRGCFPGWVTRP